MHRKLFKKRPNYEQINDDLGFDYQVVEEKQYWIEDVGYELTPSEIDKIEEATNTLHQMCFAAIDHIIQKNKFHLFDIPPHVIPYIKKSWEREDWSLYGRFDFYFDGHTLKMYEYNADTPTSLLEAALAQWEWKEGQKLDDQFNSIDDKMVAWWEAYKEEKGVEKVWFTTVKENNEDFRNTEYIMDTASRAGLDVNFIFIEEIGNDDEYEYLYDLDGNPIEHLFKLYPWEWLVKEEIGKVLLADKCTIIEPVWKMLLSNKALLAILWELYPNHEYLLPTYFSPEKLGSEYVKKPILSREGQNVEIISADINKSAKKGGLYGSDKNVYQKICELPLVDGYYPVIGSWIIGEEAAGIGIREDQSKITANLSRFVPHYFKKKKVNNSSYIRPPSGSNNIKKRIEDIHYNGNTSSDKNESSEWASLISSVLVIVVALVGYNFWYKPWSVKEEAKAKVFKEQQDAFLKTVFNDNKYNETKTWIISNIDLVNQPRFFKFLENNRKLITEGAISKDKFYEIDLAMTYTPFCIIGEKDVANFDVFLNEHLIESEKQAEFLTALKKKYNYGLENKPSVPEESDIHMICKFEQLEKDLLEESKKPGSKIIIEKDMEGDEE